MPKLRLTSRNLLQNHIYTADLCLAKVKFKVEEIGISFQLVFRDRFRVGSWQPTPASIYDKPLGSLLALWIDENGRDNRWGSYLRTCGIPS
jgi:hypothetical protein